VKVRVIAERCVGQGMCWIAAPAIFQLSDDDGHSTATGEDVPPQFEQVVRRAVRGCPEEAIEILDETSAQPA
jgi:ferredoxin